MTEECAVCEAAFDVTAPTGGLAGSVHLLPRGEVVARDGRRWKVSDPRAVVAATKAYANGAPVAIDYDHQLVHTNANGKPAPAAGWMTDFEVRADGIWASVEWTKEAADMLAARKYRFISPVFQYDSQTGEIGRIYHAGLTNTPALTLTALASAENEMTNEAGLTAQLRRLLKLPEAATADAIIESVRGLQGLAAASASPERFVPIETFQEVTAELNRTRRGVSLDAATMAVDREIEAGRLVPAMKAWAVDLCTVNKPAFDTFVESTAGPLKRLFSASAAAVSFTERAEQGNSGLRAEIARNLGHDTPSKKA